jgi:hypothetical protein
MTIVNGADEPSVLKEGRITGISQRPIHRESGSFSSSLRSETVVKLGIQE